MRRSRKRRSTAALSARALKDIRKLHREHLREVSAILTNALGFPVRVSLVRTPVVVERPLKRPTRAQRAATLAGFGVPPAMSTADFERFLEPEE